MNTDRPPVAIPISCIENLSQSTFVELSSELLVAGAFESLETFLDTGGNRESIGRMLSEADLGIRNLSHWGEPERESMRRLGRRCAALFSANSDDFSSWRFMLLAESAELIEGFAYAVGIEEFTRLTLTPETSGLAYQRASELFLAFDTLPASFQNACMAADAKQQLFKPLVPLQRSTGLYGLCDERSERPLTRALHFILDKGVDLHWLLSESVSTEKKTDLTLIQHAVDYRATGCVKAMLALAPGLCAGAEFLKVIRQREATQAYSNNSVGNRARARDQERLAIAERLDLENAASAGFASKRPAGI